jgi:hypothetical protein
MKGEIERRKEKRERGRRNIEERTKERMQRRQHGNMSSNPLCGKKELCREACRDTLTSIG